MRVLMVSSLWPPHVLGGAELYASRLADQLRSAGHEVAAFTLGVGGDDVAGSAPAWPYRLDRFATQPAWRRLAFRTVDVYNPRARRAFAAAVDRFEPDVVHSHAVAGLSPSVLAAATRSAAAHVHTLHDYWLLCRRTTFVRASGEACTRQCTTCRLISATRSAVLHDAAPDLVIAPSQSMLERHRSLPWLAGRLRLLMHPVEERPARTRPVAAPGGPITFGYAGQLTIPKGVRSLLAAFAPLAAHGHRLLVAGRGPLAEEVASAGPGVTALGWLGGEEIDAFYDSIDCLIVPSEWPENAPLVILEARARGIPVIGARTGGVPELVDPESASLLFPPGDVEALRAAMDRYAAAPFLPARAVAATWPQHVEALTDLYADARAAARSRP